MMSEESYPYEWVDLTPEDDATVKSNFGELGHCRNIRVVYIHKVFVLGVSLVVSYQ